MVGLSGKFRESVLVKLAVIAVLILALLIPVSWIRGLVSERHTRQSRAVEEVTHLWGRQQTLGGPVLAIPARGGIVVNGEPTLSRLYFLPRHLQIEGRVEPEIRRRGIFEVVVYRTDLRLSGFFDPLDLGGWGAEPDDLLWSSATVHFLVPDIQGLRSMEIRWDGRPLTVEPGEGVPGLWVGGVQANLPAAVDTARKTRSFEVEMSVLGSEALRLLPFAETTAVRLSSPWPDPSFVGSFLPDTREVSEKGFSASWRVPDLAQGRPRRWQLRFPATTVTAAGQEEPPDKAWARLWDYSFGVGFHLSVDRYQVSDRAVKYAVLFLSLTFLAFFLFEVLGGLPLHPLHYLLVGSALVLFYLLLLSLSEWIPLGGAYLAASAATVGLVTAYSASILARRRRALGLGVGLAVLYGYLWSLLQVETHALLIGSWVLFVVLALVMYVTRKIDWYQPASRMRSSSSATTARKSGIL